MKFKLKFIPKLLVFVAFLTLTNCSKEEFHEHIKNSKNKNDISFEQFKRETELTDFETKIRINPSLNAKTAAGNYELNDFDINTDVIKKLELDAKTTYTFSIHPLEPVSEKSIYNLIVHNEAGVWEKTIVEFIPTDENYQQLANGTAKRMSGTAKLLYQTLDTPTTCTTITITTFHCTNPSGNCQEGGGCDLCPRCVTYQSLTFCSADENGNGGANDPGVPMDGPGTGGEYGGGGAATHGTYVPPTAPTNADAVPSIPNLEGLTIDSDGDPNTVDDAKNIQELKKLTKKGSVLKAEIDLLKSKLTTKRTEEGMMYSSNPNFPPLEGASTKTETKWYNFSRDYYVTIHMHQNMYYAGNSTTLKPTNPVMSDVDVTATLGLYRYNGNINTTSILVSRQGTFAIRVSNAADVLNAINAMDPDNNPETKSAELVKFEAQYEKEVQKAYEAGNEAGALNEFINFINTYQINGCPLGISLYQAIFDNQRNITNWVKL